VHARHRRIDARDRFLVVLEETARSRVRPSLLERTCLEPLGDLGDGRGPLGRILFQAREHELVEAAERLSRAGRGATGVRGMADDDVERVCPSNTSLPVKSQYATQPRA